jgi:tetratricopeptide (TPR) repeat protein
MSIRLLIPALLAGALGTMAPLSAWFMSWAGTEARGDSVLAMLMGDSRTLFANHFFLKADAYFHSGYYPTIFHNREAYQTAHISEDAGAEEGQNVGDEHAFMGTPRDWIERFNRQFIPNEHTHLGATGAVGGHTDAEGRGLEREMLPWLRLSVELDPHRVESYVVAAYWLRDRLGRVEEAERFLREGLQANPDSYELVFELGRIALESHGDSRRAQLLWHVAERKWHQVEDGKPEPDYFFLRQVLAYLAQAEELNGLYADAYAHLQEADALADRRGLYAMRLDRLARLCDEAAGEGQTNSGAGNDDAPSPDGNSVLR